MLVTTPKLPPPPRSAQNRSGSLSAVARTSSPSAVTTSIGGDVVGRKPLRAGEPAHAAAERVADDADVVGRARERGEAVGRERVEDLLPDRAGTHPDRLRAGVDDDVPRQRRPQDDRVREVAERRRRGGRCPAARRAGPARLRGARRRRPARRSSRPRRPPGAGRRRGSRRGAPRRRPGRRDGRARAERRSWRSWRRVSFRDGGAVPLILADDRAASATPRAWRPRICSNPRR